jgi:hypothetical protein
LERLSSTTAGAPDELVEDGMSGYLAKPSEVRKMRGSRNDQGQERRRSAFQGEKAFRRLGNKNLNG